MSNGVIRCFEDFKRLTKEQQDFFIFDKLDSIHIKVSKFDLTKLDKRYASMWVQKIVFGLVALILVSVATAVVAQVVK